LVAAYDNKWNYIRAGNWGHIIGDEGSAYRIAVKTLNYVMKIYDGRLKYSPIIDEITKILKIKDCSEISTIVYTDLKNEDIARLAPFAIQFATKDNFLYKIIKEEAEEIAMAVKAVYLKTKYSNVYVTGG
jgi:N-acetylglucosamine kinase-like BadF-type ATPase